MVSALAERIEQAVEVLRAGGLVAFPTDTLYALGAHALCGPAVEKVFAAKRRPRSMPLSVLVADREGIALVARDVPPIGWALVERFLPGPLTLVLAKAPLVPAALTAGSDSIGVRIPAHPVALALIRGLGAPVTGTSANLSGLPSPSTAMEVRSQLGASVDFILDGGPCPGGMESTILDLTRGGPRILRPGAIPREDLEKVCGTCLLP